MHHLFNLWGEGEAKERKQGSILYHYTSRSAAESISREGIIRNVGDKILLNTMDPEHHYRNEILYNNYGENVPSHLENRADYCVRVLRSKLIEENLMKRELPTERLIYLYKGDIRVKQLDVFDKPVCNRCPQTTESRDQQSTSSSSSSLYVGKAESHVSLKVSVMTLDVQPSAASLLSTCVVRDASHVALKKPKSRKIGEIKMELRRDIKLNQRQEYQDKHVTIFAFEWMKDGLRRVRKLLHEEDLVVNVANSVKYHIVGGNLSLKDLQIVARNESSNTTGLINFGNYDGISRELIYSLKDLNRQTVIVGKDLTTNYGGYPADNKRIPQTEPVYVCDLSGLQFQQSYNTGRLVLVGEHLSKGMLDDFIYEHVVNEKKPTIDNVRGDRSGRFIEHSAGVFFDSKAYVKFVASDVVLAGIGFNHCATEPLNFKFLKYGTGFFAGPYRQLLNRFIGQGVAEGLERLLRNLPANHWIKSIELPFYDPSSAIDFVCRKYNVEVKYSVADALKRTRGGFKTATTNSADPHSMTGNRMGFGSVDGAIAENLLGKAIKFSPIMNESMTECFVKY